MHFDVAANDDARRNEGGFVNDGFFVADGEDERFHKPSRIEPARGGSMRLRCNPMQVRFCGAPNREAVNACVGAGRADNIAIDSHYRII